MASASFWRHYDATALPITNDLRVLQLPLELVAKRPEDDEQAAEVEEAFE